MSWNSLQNFNIRFNKHFKLEFHQFQIQLEARVNNKLTKLIKIGTFLNHWDYIINFIHHTQKFKSLEKAQYIAQRHWNHNLMFQTKIKTFFHDLLPCACNTILCQHLCVKQVTDGMDCLPTPSASASSQCF